MTPHVAGMNFVWQAEPDGLTVAMFAGPPLEFEFFEGAEWNSSEFEYAGATSSTCDNMLLMRGDAGYETIQDASGGDAPLITMTATPSPLDLEPVALGTMLIAEYLDLPLEIKRVAESGSAPLNLAMERGEINLGRYGHDWCARVDQQPEWFEDRFVIPVLDIAPGGPQPMPELIEELDMAPPHISEIVTEEQYRQYVGLVEASRSGGNPIVLPPGTPPEIVQAWRDAFDAAVQDDGFVQVMERSYGGQPFRVRTGEEVGELFSGNRELMSEFQDQFQSLAEELYSKYVN